jgi:hypothetical protein
MVSCSIRSLKFFNRSGQSLVSIAGAAAAGLMVYASGLVCTRAMTIMVVGGGVAIGALISKLFRGWILDFFASKLGYVLGLGGIT